ncbi:LolA family protein [Planosporangium sp. 12N6]|uniref:LolA family protein n=1 Tax=Planosporangium spinosum TaxID=3402278 RepID=UPI003CF850F5
MSITLSRPALRWAVPVAVLAAVIGGGAAARTLTASADPSLPPRTAAQLLVDLQTARLDGGSGTIVQQADLGLPALPGLGGQDGKGSTDLLSLASGSHTMRVWYAGPDRARVALIGTLGESDVIRDGRDVWTWDSQRNTANHAVLPAADGAAPHPAVSPTNLPRTPQEAADAALAAIDPTTKVTASGSARVAGRAAYELVLVPRDTGSLIGRVTLAIDAERHVPLRVAVYPAGSDSTAFKVEFTQVSFTRPDAAQFRFTPPPGARVTEQTATEPAREPSGAARQPTGAPGQPTVVGTGWTSVLVAALPADTAKALSPTGQGDRGGTGFSLASLPRVSGAWGSGRLLTGRLFSVLITDDGRLLAGAVRPEQLYAAATR